MLARCEARDTATCAARVYQRVNGPRRCDHVSRERLRFSNASLPPTQSCYSGPQPSGATVGALQVFYADGEEGMTWGQDGGPTSWASCGGKFGRRIPFAVVAERPETGRESLKVSDLRPFLEFRRTPIYDVFYRGELDYWLDMGLPRPRRRNSRVHTCAARRNDFREPVSPYSRFCSRASRPGRPYVETAAVAAVLVGGD